MCGIAGVYHRAERAPVRRAELAGMARVLAHRGPDAAGSWVAADGQVGLAARRLAVVDRRPVADQPMRGCRDDVRLVFNGELYGCAALRRELGALGHVFRSSRSDTEVVVHAYEQWGAGCVRRLRGEFAFAIWDGRTRTLCLARDRVGVKPLYFAATADRLVFASEIGALLGNGDVDDRVSPQGVYDYMTLLCVPAPRTMFHGVSMLAAGSLLVANEDQIRVESYWDAATFLNSPDSDVTMSRAVDEVDALVDDAVRLRLPDEVPFATTLSSGVDSTLVTAAAAAVTSGGGAHVAEAAGATSASEAGDARRSAAILGVDLRVHTVDDHAFHRSHQRWVERGRGGPAGAHDVIVLDAIAAAVRAEGSVVLLVGEGGDEIGGGYSSYSREGAVDGAVRRHVQVFTEEEKRGWWCGPAVQETEQLVSSLVVDIDPRLPDAGIRHALLGEYRLRLPQFLLPRVDAATMASSVEARPPLLDHLLVEHALRLPSTLSWHDDRPKYLLRTVLARRFDPRLVARRKLGFGRAFGPMLERALPHWVDSELLSVADHPLFEYVRRDALVTARTAVTSAVGPPNAAFRLWVLYALASWLAGGGP